MKKWLAMLLAVLLIVGSMAVGVHAETQFTEESRSQQGDLLHVTFTSPAGAPSGAIIGGVSCAVTVDSTTQIQVDLSALDTGLYTEVRYKYASGDVTVKGDPIIIEGTLAVSLDVFVDDNGKATFTATDENELPVPQYELALEVNGMTYQAKTDASGTHKSPYTVDVGKKATAAGLQTVYTYNGRSITYAAAAQVSDTRLAATTTVPTTTTAEGETTTTVEGETTTTVEGETTTTVPNETASPSKPAGATTTKTSVTATVQGAGTTSVQDDKIVLNASTDTALLEALGISRQDFAAKARLLLSKEHYEALVGRTGNTVMINVRTAASPVTPQMLQTALVGVSEFSRYAEDQRQMLTFDLSLLMMGRDGSVIPVTATPEGVLYTVQLPAPDSMKKCAAFAITLMDGDALMTPQAVKVENGMFEITVNSLEPYTLVGFGTADTDKAGGMSWRLIVLLVVGILLVAGAGVLLYFFVLRKPDEHEEEPKAAATAPSENDVDIYSGRTDMDNTWTPEDN